MILLLFLYIVGPKKPGGVHWVLIGVNAGIHLTALFTDICFTIDARNMFQGGWPVLKDSCLITVRKNEGGHTIVIADNGLGFDPAAIDAAEGRHIGIRNVRERLEKQCGGTLTLFSHPGAGTTVTVFIPEAGQDKQGGDAYG